MKPRLLMVIAAVISLFVIGLWPAGAGSRVAVVTAPGPALPGTSKNFQVVGKNPLYHRGMNAALAIYGHYLYVGNRTDSSSTCPDGVTTTCPHPHPGILILDIADPTHPTVVGAIGRPWEGNVGITSRELRVWPQKKLLIVMNFRCSNKIHACPPGTDATFPFDYKFFDLTDPVHPRFIESHIPTSAAGKAVKPHEMFLWVDPDNADRALMWSTTPTVSPTSTDPNLIVADISQVPSGGAVKEVAEGNWNDLYPGTDQANYPFDPSTSNGCGPYDCNLFTHSIGVTDDGTKTFLAQEAGHFLVLDTSAVAGASSPPTSVVDLHDSLLTDPTNRPVWLQDPADPAAVPSNCSRNCPNGHSAVIIPGTHYALTTDEVYGTFTLPSHGCRWGWARIIDISDPSHPAIVSEYQIQENQPSFCGSARDDALTEQFNSFSSHNPTVLPDLAIIDWHAGGVQAIDLASPTTPAQAGYYVPKPLNKVAVEDPALSRGPNKVVMWSYPIIKNGLIYVIDVRNGLYVLRYTGPHSAEVGGISFLEGNSNLGDFARLSG